MHEVRRLKPGAVCVIAICCASFSIMSNPESSSINCILNKDTLPFPSKFSTNSKTEPSAPRTTLPTLRPTLPCHLSFPFLSLAWQSKKERERERERERDREREREKEKEKEKEREREKDRKRERKREREREREREKKIEREREREKNNTTPSAAGPAASNLAWCPLCIQPFLKENALWPSQ